MGLEQREQGSMLEGVALSSVSQVRSLDLTPCRLVVVHQSAKLEVSVYVCVGGKGAQQAVICIFR